jgi:A/G-specific adenine glycosylase
MSSRRRVAIAKAAPATASAALVRRALLRFYRRHRRDLPWRRTRDPYAIWVSEIMLQQTQVVTVVPRYAEFLRRYPDVRALAMADEAKVCEAWAGLGYYRRARHLHQAACVVRDRYHGTMPTTAAELRTLPGVGRYTAGAIASIAFGEEAPVVDGNVTRLLSRLDAIDPQQQSDAALWSRAAELVRGEVPGDLNQALMEVGALVCTSRDPACRECPVERFCRARAEGAPERFPARRAPAPTRELQIAFAWIATPKGVWLERRSLEGLWAGLWELPSAVGPKAREELAMRLGVTLEGPERTLRHRLTHRDIRAAIYLPLTPPRLSRSRQLKPLRRPLAAPLSALARKAIVAMLGGSA